MREQGLSTTCSNSIQVQSEAPCGRQISAEPLSAHFHTAFIITNDKGGVLEWSVC